MAYKEFQKECAKKPQIKNGVDEKTRVIGADTWFSPQRALHQKPGFPRAHLGI
jgi:hypothetical protein